MSSNQPVVNSYSKTMQTFQKSSLISGTPIGQGGFGSVISGTLNGKNVAVKILHAPIGKRRFDILEGMFNLHHRNLISFLGIIETGPAECPQLIFIKATDGNLLDFLRERTHLRCHKATLNKFSCDIINGMEYLHQKNFIHGCLSARNILLDSFRIHLNAKISDYGMPRVIHGHGANYYNLQNGKTLPIRWMAKEAIPHDKITAEITQATDVWSFGVVVWEMWTKGQVPYGETLSNSEVRQHILNGSSPLAFNRPGRCPKEIQNVMDNIFKINQDHRPTFTVLRNLFESFATDTVHTKSSDAQKSDKPSAATAQRKRNEVHTKTRETLEYTKRTHQNKDKMPVKSERDGGRRNAHGNAGHTPHTTDKSVFPREKSLHSQIYEAFNKSREYSIRTKQDTLNSNQFSSRSPMSTDTRATYYNSSHQLPITDPLNQNVKKSISLLSTQQQIDPRRSAFPPPLMGQYERHDAPPPYFSNQHPPTPAPTRTDTTTTQQLGPLPTKTDALENKVKELEEQIAAMKVNQRVSELVEERLRKQQNDNNLFNMGRDSGQRRNSSSGHRCSQQSASSSQQTTSRGGGPDQKTKEPCCIS